MKIRTKDGAITPLVLNAAQMFIHGKLEAQRAATGKVRAIILKGRQQGCSTYVEGRFYQQTTHRRGQRAFILTHEDAATANLFEMVARYHAHCPDLVKPSTGNSNAKELIFDKLDSGYKIGTAGTKAVGRSSTIQLFHGSEVAYWPNAEGHAAGVMQAIADIEGTEEILESTANGPGDFFHSRWLSAVANDSDFVPIFIPWFWQTEYRRTVAESFRVAADETPLVETFQIEPDQLAWRRARIVDLGGGSIGEGQFKREYPNTPEEAFMASVEGTVISPELCYAAKARDVKPSAMFHAVWGVDVAISPTGDRSALAKRQGNVQLGPVKWWRGKNPMQLVGLLKAEWDATPPLERPSEIMVDVIGLGAGVVSRLVEINLPGRGINVAETESVNERYRRLRDELWFRARNWLEARDCKLADDDALISELVMPKFEPDSSGKIVVEAKKDMSKRGLPSPDLADAWCLTFAGGLERREEHELDRYARKRKAPATGWMAA